MRIMNYTDHLNHISEQELKEILFPNEGVLLHGIQVATRIYRLPDEDKLREIYQEAIEYLTSKPTRGSDETDMDYQERQNYLRRVGILNAQACLLIWAKMHPEALPQE